jgi:DNA mismatch repair protein MutS
MNVVERQYRSIKARYPEAVLLFRDGLHLVTYDEDAECVSVILGLPCTSPRGVLPMLTIAAPLSEDEDAVIARLVAAGCPVALCEPVVAPMSRTVAR